MSWANVCFISKIATWQGRRAQQSRATLDIEGGSVATGPTQHSATGDAQNRGAGRDAVRAGRAFVANNGLWFLGLCCGNIWIGWMNGTHALEPTSSWHALASATMICTLVAAACWGWRHPSRIQASYLPDWPIAVLMALFTLPAAGMLIAPEAVPAAAAVSTVMTEIGMAWLFVRWGVFLSRLSLHETVGCVFGAHVVGCAVKLLLYYVPAQMIAIPVAALPLVSIAALHQASSRAPGLGRILPDRAVPDTRKKDTTADNMGISPVGEAWCTGPQGSWGPLWKVAAFIAAWRFIFCLTRVGGISISLSTACCLAEIAVALLILYMLLVRSGSFTFQQVWSIFLVLLGVALLFTAKEDLASLGASVMAAAGSLLVMFIWLVFADISHHSTLHPFFVFGVARIAYEAPSFIASAVPGLGDMQATGMFFNCAALFCLLAFSVLFFDLRDPTLALVFSDFQKHEGDASPDALQSACDKAASTFGLTAREAEVLLLLCQGRTRAYIAETLYLSENTVRGHTQHIYTKLDVHTKTELQRKLGV